MQVFIPQKAQEDWKGYIEQMSTLSSIGAFSPVVLDFLQDLSRVLLKDIKLRAYPELIALGYWLRKSHLVELDKQFSKLKADRILKPRGLALHFAPSNVDTMFVYSWVVSMLSGNLNIIRVSQKQNEQLLILIDCMKPLLNKEEYKVIAERTFICSYEHNEEITAFLSKHCHVRVIWGGDSSVQAIRSIPLSPLATELVFADRFSSSVLRADAVLSADEDTFSKLIHNFYNDSYTFDQMACSSPRRIMWIGSEVKISQAKERFWKALEVYLEEKHYSLEPALNITRLTTAYYLAAKSYSTKVGNTSSQKPMQINVNEWNDELKTVHCGAGLFIEMFMAQLEDLSSLLTDKDQTLTHYGFSKDELLNLVENVKGRGLDRVVPVGQALAFSEKWDGYDLFLYFSREINVQM